MKRLLAFWIVLGWLGCLGFGFYACSQDGTVSSETTSGQETGTASDGGTSGSEDNNPDTATSQEAVVEAAPPEKEVVLPTLSNPKMLEPGKGITKIQIQPAVALGTDGKLGLVWTGSDQSKSLNIYFSVVDFEGKTSTPERIDSFPGGLKNEPSVCALKGGGYVAVWSVDTQVQGTKEGNLQVRFRRMDAAGKPLDKEAVQVKTGVVGNHWLSDVACGGDGGFVFTGVRVDTDNKTFGVFVQRFDSEGKAIAEASYVNPEPEGTQVHPEVAASTAGAFVVAYDDSLNNNEQVVFRLYPESGKAPNPLVVVEKGTGSLAVKGAVVAMQPDTGAFLVGALRGNGSAPILKQYKADGTSPESLSISGSGLTVQLAVEALAPHQAWGVASLHRAGSTSTLKLTLLGTADATAPSASLASGSLPAYRPALTYRNGNLVVAWTERGANSSFFVKLAWYR